MQLICDGRNSTNPNSEGLSEGTLSEFWRNKIDADIELLKQKVYLQSPTGKKDKLSFATRIKGDSKSKLWYEIIISHRFAKLQCLWLLLCFAGFLYYATTQLLKAIKNETAEYKPKQLRSTIDYSEYGSSLQYEMPYIFIHFWLDFSKISFDNDTYDYDYDYDYHDYNYDYHDYDYDYHDYDYDYLDSNISYDYDTNDSPSYSEEMITDVLSRVLESQKNFSESIITTIWLQNLTVLHEDVGVQEAVVDYERSWVRKNGVWAYFKLKLKPPAPGLGKWETSVQIRCDLFHYDNSLPPISEFDVFIEREDFSEDQQSDMVYLPYWPPEHLWWTYLVKYREIVTHMVDHTTVSEIEIELEESWDGMDYWWYLEENALGDYAYGDMMYGQDPDYTYGLIVTFKPDLVVEHWEEYVQYGYWDWVAGMGGVLSIFMLIFFKAASWIAKYMGKNSLGILPPISAAYKHEEEIALLKRFTGIGSVMALSETELI